MDILNQIPDTPPVIGIQRCFDSIHTKKFRFNGLRELVLHFWSTNDFDEMYKYMKSDPAEIDDHLIPDVYKHLFSTLEHPLNELVEFVFSNDTEWFDVLPDNPNDPIGTNRIYLTDTDGCDRCSGRIIKKLCIGCIAQGDIFWRPK